MLSASPRYIEEFGIPKRGADLAHHRCIVFTAPGRDRWPFRTADGIIEHIEVAPAFASDSLQCILQLSLEGGGIARLANFLVADSIRAGKLVQPSGRPARGGARLGLCCVRSGYATRPQGARSISWSSVSSISPGGWADGKCAKRRPTRGQKHRFLR